jgi:arylsulfatase A-like enzyme
VGQDSRGDPGPPDQAGHRPEGTKLAPKPEAIKDWDKLSADEKCLFTRQVETFAAFLDYTDHEIGRMVKAIEEMGELDNTLIFYIAGDNGASAEGGQNGMFNEYAYFNGVQEKVEGMLKHVDECGGPTTYPHMVAGWAVAFDAPFGWTKQVASDFGGTRNGMVLHWPKGMKARDSHPVRPCDRRGPHHSRSAAKLPEPKSVNGTPQTPIEGTSLVYSFDDAKAAERHTTQYFEIAGNRAVYHEGWFARTIHRAPWEAKPRRALAEDIWELYDVRSNFSLTTDLAAKNPEKLKEVQALFMREAEKYDVTPIDDRTFERLNGALVGRPDSMGGRTSITLAEGMPGMLEGAFLNT